jgi:poly-D-alanine transfer protein DltD
VQGGWELLLDKFKVAGTNLKWARTKLEGKNTWYIGLGSNCKRAFTKKVETGGACLGLM